MGDRLGQKRPDRTRAEVLPRSGGFLRLRPATLAEAGSAWMLVFSRLLSAMSFSITFNNRTCACAFDTIEDNIQPVTVKSAGQNKDCSFLCQLEKQADGQAAEELNRV